LDLPPLPGTPRIENGGTFAVDFADGRRARHNIGLMRHKSTFKLSKQIAKTRNMLSTTYFALCCGQIYVVREAFLRSETRGRAVLT
jgi:hypothetical protein